MIKVIKASAGSGKTASLIRQIENLIKNGLEPERILAFTFTVNARDELRARLKKIGNVRIETMHSLFYSLMRIVDSSKYQKVLSEMDKENLLLKVISINKLSFKLNRERITIKDISQFIGLSKNLNVYPIGGFKSVFFSKKKFTLYSFDEHKLISNYNKVCTISQIGFNDKGKLDTRKLAMLDSMYSLYESEKIGIDFDDMLLITHRLVETNANNICEYIQNAWDCILVDEFQDTNTIQFSIIKKMIERHNNLFLIGDWKQSIYEWRGSDFTLLKDIHLYLEGVKVDTLPKTYRNSKKILEVANIVSTEMLGDIPIETNVEHDGSVSFIPFMSNKEEAVYVGDKICELYSEPDKDAFVLSRTNSQLNLIEAQLLKADIPYYIPCTSVFKTSIALDMSALLYIIEYPDDLDPKPFGRAMKFGCEFVSNQSKEEFFARFNPSDVKDSAHEIKIRKFLDSLEFLRKREKSDLNTFISECVNLFEYESYIEKISSKADLSDNLDCLEMIKSVASDFETIEEFLLFYFKKYNTNTRDYSSRIKLLTIHASKGLEADTVFIIGNDADTFPSKRSFFTADHIEAEKRLLYVAVTRAKNHLIFTNHKNESDYVSFIKRMLKKS